MNTTVRWRCGDPLVAAPLLAKRRDEWLRMTKGYTGDETTRRQQGRLLRWLRRHDTQWLNSNKGRSRKKNELPRKQINWLERDRELARAVSEQVAKLRNRPGKPRRLTPSYIVREIAELRRMASHLSRLPLTRKALAASVEAEREYWYRRAIWAVNSIRAAGQTLSLTRMRQRIGSRKAWSPEMKSIVDTVMSHAKFGGIETPIGSGPQDPK